MTFKWMTLWVSTGVEGVEETLLLTAAAERMHHSRAE